MSRSLIALASILSMPACIIVIDKTGGSGEGEPPPISGGGMGPGLADNRPEGRATGTEWKTPPLWGIGLTEQVSGHNEFMHDGRARSLIEAILWHGGEAQSQRDTVAAMQPEDRDALLAFLGSL